MIGISLPIKDWVGEEYHEIQFWEETGDFPPMDHPASEVYNWLLGTLRARSVMGGGGVPRGMPLTFEGLTVRTYRTGKAGHIVYELEGNLARSLESLDHPASEGYARLGTDGMYSMMMAQSSMRRCKTTRESSRER
jgi:hypothetical protein